MSDIGDDKEDDDETEGGGEGGKVRCWNQSMTEAVKLLFESG